MQATVRLEASVHSLILPKTKDEPIPMDRREMLRVVLASGATALLVTNRTNAADRHPTGASTDPMSPSITNAFTIELPPMQAKKMLTGGAKDLALKKNGGFMPNGTVYPQISGNDALTTYPNSLERIVAAQQRNSGGNIQYPPELFYVLDVKQFVHRFHTDAPYGNGSTMWGYDGQFPGPTFVSRHGVPILVRIINSLYDDRSANPVRRDPRVDPRTIFGDARISTHLHNGHTASESDGNPTDIYPPSDRLRRYPASIRAIRFRDHHYAMFRAGLNPNRPANMPVPNVNDGDLRESLSTLWYHDHSDHFTSENVYKGLVGFHLFFDEIDSGDENADPSGCALRLPSEEFDVPILLQDKRFNAQGQLILTPPSADNRGFLGDMFTVNGIIQPKLRVLRRKYRFRVLNAGPSRFYQIFLTLDNGGETKPVDHKFFQIGNDESLLPDRVTVDSTLVSVAERADIVVDFSRFQTGDKVYLVNRLVMLKDGSGPEFELDDNDKFVRFNVLPDGGDRLMMFEVMGDAPDASQVPCKLRPSPVLPSYIPSPLSKNDIPTLKALKNYKEFEFLRKDLKWKINGLEFDPSIPAEVFRPVPNPSDPGKFFDGYVLTLKNNSASTWSHPVHIHLEEFRILLRDGNPPDATEACKKDVLLLRPNEEVQVFLRFRDFLGRYPVHCHNVVHEDHTMMLRFDVAG